MLSEKKEEEKSSVFTFLFS